MTNLTSEDESTKLLKMTDKYSYHPEFDNMSSSSEETIYVDKDTDKHNLMSNPRSDQALVLKVLFLEGR